MITKYASADIIDVRHSDQKEAGLTPERFNKLAAGDPRVSDDGYLYVRVRAISSRVNKNDDGWPSAELAKGYKTFSHRPIFIDHNNDNPERTRGVIVSSVLHIDDDKTSSLDPYYSNAPENHKPATWIDLLLEVDAKSFPKLAKAILTKEIDAVSMGCNIGKSKCSICEKVASSPAEYCDHIRSGKGQEFEVTSSDGGKMHKKAYEDCFDCNFFEISFVFDPADPSALIQDIRSEAKTAAGPYDQEAEPDDLWAGEPEGQEGLVTAPPNRANEDERVRDWRVQQLEAAKFTPEQIQAVLQLLDHQDMSAKPIGVRDFTNLTDQGATPDQAYAIQSKRMKGGTTSRLLDASLDFELEEKTAIQEGTHNLNDQSERNLNYLPQSQMETAPEQINTLRTDVECPRCSTALDEDKTVNGLICEHCGYTQPVEGMDNPDLSLHHRLDQKDFEDKEPENGELGIPVPGHDEIFEAPEAPISPVAPVNAISNTHSKRVISEMNFIQKNRFIVKDAAEHNEKESADKKVLIADPTKKGTDQPQGTKIIADQLAPVETHMEKETDREVIERVEEDGQGVKRTEKIVKEFGPMGEGDTTVDLPGGEDMSDDAPLDLNKPEEDKDPLAESDENPINTTETTPTTPGQDDQDKDKWSSEKKLFAAFKLAKLAIELGLVSAEDELKYVSSLEAKSKEKIEERFEALTEVKEAGLSKKKTSSLTRRTGFPAMPKVAAKFEVEDVPFEAIFL